MQFNWVDGVIVAVAAYYVYEGWEVGFVKLVTSLVSFLASLWLAIKSHGPVGNFFAEKFGVPGIWSEVAGYVAVAFLSETLILQILTVVLGQLPSRLAKFKMNRLAGALVSATNALVTMAFILVVVLALPLRGSARNDIKSSQLGNGLVRLAERYGGELKSSLDQVAAEAVRFLTIKPSSNESIDLKLDPAKLTLKVDPAAEATMLDLVNAERAKEGVKPLRLDPDIVPVARAHGRDMFMRSYFAHNSPEGDDAGDRLQVGGVKYNFAGENLAYAPDVHTAHEGLMNSEGHRHNILEPKFGRVGIGVIDAGIYGMMFVQNFAD